MSGCVGTHPLQMMVLYKVYLIGLDYIILRHNRFLLLNHFSKLASYKVLIFPPIVADVFYMS